MEVIPAIDLMKGDVVRLRRGDPSTVKVFKGFNSPLKTADKWEREGARRIHVIDLDAATGRGNNFDVVSSIIQEVNIPVQVGGGIRSRKRIEELFKIGVDRIIFATFAFEKTKDFRCCLREYGDDRIIIALDYLGHTVMSRGWATHSGLTLDTAIDKFTGFGVRMFLLTSISKDGLLTGPDLKTLEDVVRKKKVMVLAAGGIRRLQDLTELKRVGVVGAVVGRALYEGSFRLSKAIELVRD